MKNINTKNVPQWKKYLAFGIVGMLALSIALFGSNDEVPPTKPLPKIEDVAYFKIGLADYWIFNYEKKANKSDLINFFKENTKQSITSYAIFVPDSVDLSYYKTQKYNEQTFMQSMVNLKPKYAFYRMMPADTTVYDDALDYIKYGINK